MFFPFPFIIILVEREVYVCCFSFPNLTFIHLPSAICLILLHATRSFFAQDNIDSEFQKSNRNFSISTLPDPSEKKGPLHPFWNYCYLSHFTFKSLLKCHLLVYLTRLPNLKLPHWPLHSQSLLHCFIRLYCIYHF